LEVGDGNAEDLRDLLVGRSDQLDLAEDDGGAESRPFRLRKAVAGELVTGQFVDREV
jgi:hypothetical protein